MKNALLFIGSILLFSIIVLGTYLLLKKFVFDKVKVNKWVVLAIAVVEFVAPPFLFPTMPKIVINYVVPGVFVILFFWFMDLSGFRNKSKGKATAAAYNYGKSKSKSKNKRDDIIIRPKAKPNRVKQNQNNK